MSALTDYEIEKRDRLEKRANELEAHLDQVTKKIEGLLGEVMSREFYALSHLFREFDRAHEDYMRADERLDEFHRNCL